ncbi:MAG: indole-3-glycerol phosphate synthase TrpC [Fimbriimonadaceae bacterium]
MSKLKEIFAHKRAEVEKSKLSCPREELQNQAAGIAPRGFRQALASSKHETALIAEVKKASPSQGTIRADFDPVQVAQAYEGASADCLSVLTDEKYFRGSPSNLQKVRAATNLPLLRKDFIFDSYQLLEACAWGADAVLLIVAGIEKLELFDLYHESRVMGLDVLLEVHNEQECEVALELGAGLVGINNRDLSTFTTDLTVTERLAPLFPETTLVVSESALSTYDEIARVRSAGARAVLIGTTFCASPDIGAKVREVMNW